MSRDFDRTASDHLDLGDISAIEFSYPFSISAWVKLLRTLPGTSTWFGILTKYNPTSAQRAYLFAVAPSNKHTFWLSDNGSSSEILAATTAFDSGDLGTWFHLVFTADASRNYNFYRNGSGDGSGTVTKTSIFAGTATSQIGAGINGGDFEFDGQLAEVAAWNVELTANEVAAMANGYSTARTRPGSFLGYWPILGVSDPEPDLSGNANNGVLSGATSADHPPTAPPFGFDLGWQGLSLATQRILQQYYGLGYLRPTGIFDIPQLGG